MNCRAYMYLFHALKAASGLIYLERRATHMCTMQESFSVFVCHSWVVKSNKVIGKSSQPH
jgi:hypothetical protein